MNTITKVFGEEEKTLNNNSNNNNNNISGINCFIYIIILFNNDFSY